MRNDIIVYIRDNTQKPVATLYVTYNKSHNLISIGWSKVHKKDTCIKKIGKNIAERRAINAEDWYMTTKDHIVVYENFNNVDGIPQIIIDNINSRISYFKHKFNIDDQSHIIIPHTTKEYSHSVDLGTLLTDNGDENYKHVIIKKTRYIIIEC